MENLLYIGIGLVIGFYGTLVGIGGGFIIVPLLVNYLGFGHSLAAGTSLLVVFANSFSGSISYAMQRKIDYSSGTRFALASIPGVFIGYLINHAIDNMLFSLLFAGLLLCVALFILLRKKLPTRELPYTDVGSVKWPIVHRRLVDTDGAVHEYRFNELYGMLISFGVGIIAALFGIGGGLIHVPVLVLLFTFPVHIATATSHYILCIGTLASALIYGVSGDISWPVALLMGSGAVVGAQIGGAVSKRFKESFILRLLGLLLLFLAAQMVIKALKG